MKIRKVKWNDHPILGDLMLDLTDASTDSHYETIVFAGENGSGKSTILEVLSAFLNIGTFQYFEYIEYFADGGIHTAIPTSDNAAIQTFFDVKDSAGNVLKIRSDKNNNKQSIEQNKVDPRHYGCIISKARADYKTKKITATTTSALDKEKYDTDGSDDFTSLKQLVVDVVNQDNAEYASINRNMGSNPKSWDDFYLESKLFRFKSSFDQFFDNIAYDSVADHDGEKTILFDKNGTTVVVDMLSTGEKQIVFRGIYLLKNSKMLHDATVMIDEPELSMHPKWQRKIMQYYRGLFTPEGVQNVQLFFATHSDHVLKEALLNRAKTIVIVLEENNGRTVAKKIDSPFVLPTITTAETTYLAFDLTSNDYHIELYGWIQDKESKQTVKSCDEFIKQQSDYDASLHSKPSSFGSTNYETLPTYIRNAIHHPDSGNEFTENELRISTELLVSLCR